MTTTEIYKAFLMLIKRLMKIDERLVSNLKLRILTTSATKIKRLRGNRLSI